MNKPASAIYFVLSAQFFSALADNATLFVLLAFLKTHFYPDWQLSALQAIFVLMFVFCAPFVGAIADGFQKGKVLFYGNAIKLLGALILLRVDAPFLGYACIGFGAAIYSPAKYGILCQLTTEQHLIKANAWLESSTLIAILLGSFLGGLLGDYDLKWGLLFCLGAYAFSLLCNLWIPVLPIIQPFSTLQKRRILTTFCHHLQQLIRLPATKITLITILLFWSAAVLLRFLLIHWIPFALHIDDTKTPALFNGFIGIGIILGSMFASKYIHFDRLFNALICGAFMGLMIFILMLQTHFYFTVLILLGAGFFGGVLVVPFNAFLQHMGEKTVGAGNAVAIQNLGENAAMMLTLLLYTIAIGFGVSVTLIGLIAGAIIGAAFVILWWLVKFKSDFVL